MTMMFSTISVCVWVGGGTDDVRGQKVYQLINLQSHSLRCQTFAVRFGYYIVSRTYRLFYYFYVMYVPAPI